MDSMDGAAEVLVIVVLCELEASGEVGCTHVEGLPLSVEDIVHENSGTSEPEKPESLTALGIVVDGASHCLSRKTSTVEAQRMATLSHLSQLPSQGVLRARILSFALAPSGCGYWR